MTVEELETEVSRLSAEKLARFRAWFEQFDADAFDRKIEAGAKSGKLDRLADAARDDVRNGSAREL